jgi:DNA-binding NarL/FixJ family response regulator
LLAGFGSILIVDEDEEATSLVSALLSKAGYGARGLGCGEEALQAAREERPSMVVLEVCLPDLSGYSICRQLRDEHGEDLPIVLMSARRTESFDRAAGFLVGADEFFAKPIPGEEFLIRVRRLIKKSTPPVVTTLTTRELDVLRLLAQGLGQKEIARELYLSPKTISTHLERIYKKLGVRTRTQAVATALRDSLVEIS